MPKTAASVPSQAKTARRASRSGDDVRPAPEDEFLAILNNRGKLNPAIDVARELGFTIVTSGTPSLQFLQAKCLSQTYNQCLTARYRVGLGPVVGTLLASFLSDLRALELSAKSPGLLRSLKGDFLPSAETDPRQTPWRRLLEHTRLAGIVHDVVPDLDRPSQALTPGHIERLLGILRDPELLGTGQRLVLFCELHEYMLLNEFLYGLTAGPSLSMPLKSEWLSARSQIFDQLPERVGIVFGVTDIPPDSLPLGDVPHQRLLTFTDPPHPVEHAQVFKPAALAGDYPAYRDEFGLAEEATAIARLILHPQTDPMTISIEAPWGKGKSSFLNFVSRALTELASERVNPGLGWHMEHLTDRASALDRERLALSRLAEDESAQERSEREDRLLTVEKEWLSISEQERSLRAAMTRAAQADVLEVRFNAWRHQDARYIWAGLVSEVSRAVEQSLPRRRRWTAPLSHAFRTRLSELVFGVGLPTLLAAIAALALTFLGVQADSQDLGADVPFIVKLLVPGSAVVALLAWRLYRVIQPVSQRVLDYVRLPDYRDQLGHQEQVLADLNFLRSLLRRGSLRWDGWRLHFEKRDPRIVVFIDDLDRCTDDKIMEVLQTVNLILVQGASSDIERSGSTGAFVLLAVDTEKIHQAINHYYEKQGAAAADPDFAQSYLRKIIQLPYYLPEPVAERRVSLIDGFFSPSARAGADGQATPPSEGGDIGNGAGNEDERSAVTFPIDPGALLPTRIQVFTEVEDTQAELDTFRTLRAFIPDNPREMKRLLNFHRFVKILLQRPEAPPDERLQRKLVAWLIFCARWEDFVDDMIICATEAADTKPEKDCLLWLEEVKNLGDSLEGITSFRRVLAGDGLGLKFAAEDLVRDGFLAQAAIRTRLVRWNPAPDRTTKEKPSASIAETKDT